MKDEIGGYTGNYMGRMLFGKVNSCLSDLLELSKETNIWRKEIVRTSFANPTEQGNYLNNKHGLRIINNSPQGSGSEVLQTSGPSDLENN